MEKQDLINQLINKKRAWLTLAMGSGKTYITLQALAQTKAEGTCLILAPSKIVNNVWASECEKFSLDFKVIEIKGTPIQKIKLLSTPADAYVVSIDSLDWLVKITKNFTTKNFTRLVIDESTVIKNTRSKRFKTLKNNLKTFTRRILLTGTPSPNGYKDFFAQIYTLDDGTRLGTSITAYLKEYFYPTLYVDNYAVAWQIKVDAPQKIIAKVQDLIISAPSDKLSVKYYNYFVDLSDKELVEYKTLKRDKVFNSTITASTPAVLVQKLRQLANGSCRLDTGGWYNYHNHKINALKSIVAYYKGENILIYYNYLSELAKIKELLPNAKELNGTTIKQWNNGEIKYLLANPISCGYGLNLQKGGHIIVWMSPTYDSAVYTQANARLIRHGQNNTVIVIRIIANKTIDETIYKVLENKYNTQNEYLKAIIRKEQNNAM